MTARPIDEERIQELYARINEVYERISEFSLTESDFSRDRAKSRVVAAYVDSVVVSFYRAIEEANNLTFDTKAEYPAIPWEQVRGMRNAIAHAYFSLDLPTVWRTIQDDLPELKKVCEQYAADHNVSLGGERSLGLKDRLHGPEKALGQ